MLIQRRILVRTAPILAVALAVTLGGAEAITGTPAQATTTGESRTIPVIVYDRYTTVSKVKTSNYTNKSQTIGDCLVTKAGSRCTITRMKSATRTVGLALGATRGIVSADLNISSAASVSESISCTSPALPKNGRYRAWPRGDRFTYKVKRQTIVSGAVASTSTSGTLSAFNPKTNTITCG